AGISTATQQIGFTALFGSGTNAVTVSVTDPSDCVATCATALAVLTTGAPSIICPAPMTVSCSPATGTPATISVAVPDESGQPTVVVWTLNGSPVQTNFVPAGGPAQFSFTTTLAIATNELSITASNSLGCVTTCSTSISVIGLGDVYPMALNIRSLVGV